MSARTPAFRLTRDRVGCPRRRLVYRGKVVVRSDRPARRSFSNTDEPPARDHRRSADRSICCDVSRHDRSVGSAIDAFGGLIHGVSVFLYITIHYPKLLLFRASCHKNETMPTAARVRVFAADSAPPAQANGSGSDSELCDAIKDSGDIAADGAATDDAEEEQSPVDLDSILENPTPSRGVTADGDGEEADDEEDNSEGEDEESAVDSDNERDDMGVEEGGGDELQGGEVGAGFNPCVLDFSSGMVPLTAILLEYSNL